MVWAQRFRRRAMRRNRAFCWACVGLVKLYAAPLRKCDVSCGEEAFFGFLEDLLGAAKLLEGGKATGLADFLGAEHVEVFECVGAAAAVPIGEGFTGSDG